MSKADLLKNLVKELSNILPAQLSALKKDFESQCHRVLNQTFSKLDLVTREEFDAQTKVLARTRKKLEALEKQLQTWEEVVKRKKTTTT
jgi:BMFP domain-containing protein YqiC